MNTFTRPRLTINLTALKRNYKALCAKRPSATTAAIGKANAYGLGMAPVATALYEADCRTFFTAYTFEAIDLRRLFPDHGVEIYVFNGPAEGEEDSYRANNLIPVLNTPAQIAMWQNSDLPCVLHLDTGMNRLGLATKEAMALLDDSATLSKLDVKYLLSHFACSSDPDADKNHTQYKEFCDLTKQVASLFPSAKTSISSSGGLFLPKELDENLTRPGVALYGISPQGSPLNALEPVASLEAPVVQTRTIEQDETVGYGATYTATAKRKIATISIGYADGYMRSLSNKGFVMIRGEKFPVVGIVSMDLITVDVTEASTEIQTGDVAECFGTNILIEDLAKVANTIPYELLVGLGNRVERIYKD